MRSQDRGVRGQESRNRPAPCPACPATPEIACPTHRRNDARSAPELLYYFCRLQMPASTCRATRCEHHLQRTFGLYQKKVEQPVSWEAYLDHLYPLDWFLASACLEGNRRRGSMLFASRAGRSDCLLMDALRARAARLYPRDEERQDTAVADFWGHLCIAEAAGSLPVLARFDGQRPLVPWLIRVFQNWHISQLRKHTAGAGAARTTTWRCRCHANARSICAGARSSPTPPATG